MKISFDAKNIGLAFADSDDSEQAAFFNEFGRAMQMAIRTDHKRDMQLCYAADKLDANGEWLVTELAEYVKLRKGKQ